MSRLGADGFQALGMTIGKTAIGGSEVVITGTPRAM